MKTILASLMLTVCLSHPVQAQPQSLAFDDPMFRRCVTWLLTGAKGGMIEAICSEEYAIPTPSLVICVQKLTTGFASKNDQEVCALIFEDKAKTIRASFVK
jgi:hypothetical protein